MCCPLVFEFSVGIGGFVIGLGQISFFFSLLLGTKTIFKYNKENLHKPFSFNNIALNTSKMFNIEIKICICDKIRISDFV